MHKIKEVVLRKTSLWISIIHILSIVAKIVQYGLCNAHSKLDYKKCEQTTIMKPEGAQKRKRRTCSNSGNVSRAEFLIWELWDILYNSETGEKKTIKADGPAYVKVWSHEITRFRKTVSSWMWLKHEV